jgi:tetratricopeptide (TPR) repeat protein
LVSAARQQGLLALSGPTQLDSLLSDVAAGFPVIVLQNLRFTFWPQWHYAVVVGYDQREGVVLLRSGQYRLIEVPYNTFINTWQRADRWALRVTRPTHLPPSATTREIVDAAEALAQVRHPSAALVAYVTASQRWPDDTRLWNGLANLAYAQQRWTLAQQAFAQSLLRDARQARLWNNFAYALQQTGCNSHATAALSCAQKLAPNDPYFRDSRTDLDRITSKQAHACDIIITTQCMINPATARLPDVRLQ